MKCRVGISSYKQARLLWPTSDGTEVCTLQCCHQDLVTHVHPQDQDMVSPICIEREQDCILSPNADLNHGPLHY